jgi:very-short-patch-repair endonuclease
MVVTKPSTHALARQLRWSASGPERELWALLRRNNAGLRFRRQHPIGPYVLDFYCASLRLCVEVDGPAHEDVEQMERDAIRDAWLLRQRIQVLRFPTAAIKREPGAVVTRIKQAAATPSVAFGATSPMLRIGEGTGGEHR